MGTIINVALSVFAGLFILIGLLIGLGRKTVRSSIRLASVVVAALLALLTARLLGGLSGSTALGLLSNLGGELPAELVNAGALHDLAVSVSGVVFALVLFGLLFVIFSLLMLIPYHFVSKALVKDKKKEAFKCDKLVGMLVGAVTGLVVCSILCAPLLGVVRTVGDIKEEIDLGTETEDLFEVVDAVNGNWFAVQENTYGSLVYHGLMTTRISGLSVDLANEVTRFGPSLTKLAEMDGEPSFGQISTLVRDFTGSDLFCAGAAGILKDAVAAWDRGESYLGLEKISAEGGLDRFLDKLMHTLADGDGVALKNDLSAVSSVFDALDRHGAAEAFAAEDEGAMLSLLGEEGLMHDVLDALSSTPRMRTLLPEVANLGVAALGEMLGMPENKGAVRDTLLADLADALNAKGNASAFRTAFDGAFKTAGVTIDNDLAGLICDNLYKAFDKAGTVLPEDVGAFFDTAFDLGGAEMTVGSKTLGAAVLTASDDENVQRFAAALRAAILEKSPDIVAQARTLQNNETFVTTVKTVDDILLSSDVLNNLSEDELKQEVQTLSDSFGAALRFVASAQESEGSLEDLDLALLGSALDGLTQKSVLFADTGKELVGALLSSPILGDVGEGVRDALGDEGLDALTDGSVKMEDLFGITQKTALLLEAASDDSLTEDERMEKVRESLSWLVTHVSDENVGAFKKLLGAATLKSLGIPDDAAESMSFMLGVLFDNLSEMSRMTDDEEKKEAAALQRLLDVSLNGKAMKEAEASDFVADIARSKVMIGTLRDLCAEKGSDPLGLSLSKNDKKSVTDGLKKFVKSDYASAADKSSFASDVKALGSFFGVTVSDSDITAWAK